MLFMSIKEYSRGGFFVTSRNEVVAKVIFLHLSVIHSVHRGEGVCLSACWDTNPPGADTPLPPGADTPLEQTPPDQTSPPDQQTPPDQTPPRTRHPADSSRRSTSGRYTSYWNAFLFILVSIYPVAKALLKICISSLIWES